MTTPPAAQNSTADHGQGSKYARLSLISAIVGFFIFGFVLGPVAIALAKKAERLGVSATFGKVLGRIDIILWILVVLGSIMVVLYVDPELYN